MIQSFTVFPKAHGNKSQPKVSCLRWENLEQPHRISHISSLRESIWWLPVLFGNCIWKRQRARPGELLKEGAWENAEATCLHQCLRIGMECAHLRGCRQEELLSKDQYHPLIPWYQGIYIRTLDLRQNPWNKGNGLTWLGFYFHYLIKWRPKIQFTVLVHLFCGLRFMLITFNICYLCVSFNEFY